METSARREPLARDPGKSPSPDRRFPRRSDTGILVLAFLILLSGCTGGGTVKSDLPEPLSPDSLHTWMEKGRRVVLFDVRPGSLYVRQRLPLAVRAHGASISDLRDLIPMDSAVPMVVYNETGRREEGAGDLGEEMVRYGFPRVYWLEGGIAAWVNQGYNVDGARTFPRR